MESKPSSWSASSSSLSLKSRGVAPPRVLRFFFYSSDYHFQLTINAFHNIFQSERKLIVEQSPQFSPGPSAMQIETQNHSSSTTAIIFKSIRSLLTRSLTSFTFCTLALSNVIGQFIHVKHWIIITRRYVCSVLR